MNVNKQEKLKLIKQRNIKELTEFLNKQKIPQYRLHQILEWLYIHEVDSFEQMTNIPKSLIESLTRSFVNTKPECIYSIIAHDLTKKYIFKVENNNDSSSCSYLEAVAIPSNTKNSKRLTVCISSQVGCAMRCNFCATGKQGFTRNLYVGEIVDQILYIQNDLNHKVSNVVFMGQGEPLLNFINLKDSLYIINNYLNIGARKITISTCGIIPGILKFSEIKEQYGLALSLHSAIQEKRDALMPGVKNYTLERLREAISLYITKTNRRPTFEYLMLKSINDTQEDLNALIKYCKGLNCHVNLIKYNNVTENTYSSSPSSRINKWIINLNSHGIQATLRDSRGSDIDAACGQLLNKYNN